MQIKLNKLELITILSALEHWAESLSNLRYDKESQEIWKIHDKLQHKYKPKKGGIK